MIMRDQHFNEIKVGQTVHFGLRFDQWQGEVVEVSHAEEQVIIKKKIKYSDNSFTYITFNKIECSNYISIINI